MRGSRIPTPRLRLIVVPHGLCSSPLGRLLSRCPCDKIRLRNFCSPSDFGQGRLCFYHFSYRKATRTRSFHRTFDVSRLGITVRSPIVAASPFQPGMAAMQACTRASPLAFAIGGLPPGRRVGLAADASPLLLVFRSLGRSIARRRRRRAVGDDGYPLVPLHGPPTPFSNDGTGASYYGKSLATKGDSRRARLCWGS